MIISASRRTDIPALYSKWFMNRVRAGWCAVANPMNAKQISHVSLKPQDVDVIVFWSKNPAPMLEHLSELDQLGFRYYFQVSLNDYPPELEPNIPSFDDRLETFLELSRRVGPFRVIWRFDPIIISNITSADYIRQKFECISHELQGSTHRVIVSIVDFYQKTERRLAALEKLGYVFDREAAYSSRIDGLLKDIADTAKNRDLEIYSCAEDRDYSNLGIPPGGCIDDKIIQRLWSTNLRYTKDPSQRQCCLCTVSKDIGINDTCIHGCPYCYSTRSLEIAERRYNEHDPNSPVLWGDLKYFSSMVDKSSPQLQLPL